MPHQCVRCSTLYEDGSKQILKGCPCGAKLFFFIRKQNIEDTGTKIDLSEKEKEQIEKDVFDLAGVPRDTDKPVILDLESINILKPGKYEIDLISLFKKDPLVFKLEEGKYVIDIPETFKKFRDEGE